MNDFLKTAWTLVRDRKALTAHYEAAARHDPEMELHCQRAEFLTNSKKEGEYVEGAIRTEGSAAWVEPLLVSAWLEQDADWKVVPLGKAADEAPSCSSASRRRTPSPRRTRRTPGTPTTSSSSPTTSPSCSTARRRSRCRKSSPR